MSDIGTPPWWCEHYACRCARAAELAAMGRTLDAIAVHAQFVPCRDKDVARERVDSTARQLLER